MGHRRRSEGGVGELATVGAFPARRLPGTCCATPRKVRGPVKEFMIYRLFITPFINHSTLGLKPLQSLLKQPKFSPPLRLILIHIASTVIVLFLLDRDVVLSIVLTDMRLWSDGFGRLNRLVTRQLGSLDRRPGPGKRTDNTAEALRGGAEHMRWQVNRARDRRDDQRFHLRGSASLVFPSRTQQFSKCVRRLSIRRHSTLHLGSFISQQPLGLRTGQMDHHVSIQHGEHAAPPRTKTIKAGLRSLGRNKRHRSRLRSIRQRPRVQRCRHPSCVKKKNKRPAGISTRNISAGKPIRPGTDRKRARKLVDSEMRRADAIGRRQQRA
mmetsp:Transcript_14544/g.37143  ORF Transcript_14544/g.37143 Transcript_14544/m.37143 type:complete len:325 (-) Transcript_14544:504-1478(-)